eukprot:2285548-Pyramimonas_sp.AAC.1
MRRHPSGEQSQEAGVDSPATGLCLAVVLNPAAGLQRPLTPASTTNYTAISGVYIYTYTTALRHYVPHGACDQLGNRLSYAGSPLDY